MPADGSRKEQYQELYTALGQAGESFPPKANLVRRLLSIRAGSEETKAIEFGCGMGQDAIALSKATGWRVDATDSAKAMLNNLPHRLNRFILDVTNSSSFPHGEYDVAYCSFLVHLLTSSEKLTFYHGAHSALKPGGVLVILTASSEDLRRRKLTHYFPSSLEMDRQRYLTLERNQALLKQAGFAGIFVEPIALGTMQLDEEVALFEKRSCSVLGLISDREYHEGMERLRAASQRTPDTDRADAVPWKRTLIIARKPRD